MKKIVLFIILIIIVAGVILFYSFIPKAYKPNSYAKPDNNLCTYSDYDIEQRDKEKSYGFSENRNDTPQSIAVKFTEGSKVKISSGKLISRCGEDLSAFYSILDKYNGVIYFDKVFTSSKFELDIRREETESRSNKKLEDLSLWFVIYMDSNEDFDLAEDMARKIFELPYIDHSYLQLQTSTASSPSLPVIRQ